MKRLVVCCDGTWQNLTNLCPSNIVKLSQSVKRIASDGIPQVVFYGAGIGSENNKILGLTTGLGIDQSIQDAYKFLSLNYVDGDEIYLFGFSRGAYTVRSLAGMIYCSGLLSRQHITEVPTAYELYRNRNVKPSSNEARKYREKYGKNQGKPVDITLLGCFDTVSALGIPLLPIFKMFAPLLHKRYKFYDTTLNKYVQNALHAMAIDEVREIFDVTRMIKNPDAPNQRLIEKWFPGKHGCVGGGTEEYTQLSDGPLKWMIESIKDLGLGLEFDLTSITIESNPTINFKNNVGIYKLAGIKLREVGDDIEELHETSISRLENCLDYRPKNLNKIISKINLN
ncbi:DUF2235 domain-containing protein [Dolichospermum circinale CS-534/05]|uniref:DUF2235 domain-containing protein n=1 Tax=Dolichospermum circinale TaxID=109265 RepID=UPI002330467A|nr:DUF2235 domain-containing protein [Dolichospermum circinale]MDB9492859.1 DUF2235 domain-containing protein [Dolichospermum circinale CS-534/05]MDB9548866.1 DUF2235 domain-containing protein [Dolichospermum circinale CS-1031]